MISRWRDSMRSFFALPRWVQLWVGVVLVPVNVAPFFLLDTPVGRAAAIASVFVLLTNVPIMLHARGMSRLMSVPHLIAWIPLVPYLVARLVFKMPVINAEVLLASALVVVNGISLVFDMMDTMRWLCGRREIPGQPSHCEETCK